ncbi:MAG: response regulator transcription factor [Pseudomonadota bacterium]
MRVLLIEDQYDIAANIWDFLERRGHEVDHAGDGSTGLARALGGSFDAVVLDLGLPRLDGLELCRRLRAAGRGTPVLMLTARDTLEDKLRGYAEGADDYMVKPFEMRELDARLRALTRHLDAATQAPIAFGPLTFFPGSLTARRGHAEIALTRTQGALLKLLMQRAPSIVSHAALARELWGVDTDQMAALHNQVYTLRALIDRPFDTALIHAVRGVGYRLVRPSP